MKEKGLFPVRYKMKIVNSNNGKILKTIKTKNLKYVYSQIEEAKQAYSTEAVEFMIVASEVLKINKPRLKLFKNIPEWDISHWGVNSQNEYYAANEDYSKVVRLYETL